MNVAAPLRSAILASAPIAAALSEWNGAPAVFTRRPAPADALYPLIQISPDLAVGDQDGLTSRRPIIERDVAVYGQADQYRTVEEIGYRLRELFHRPPRFLLEIPDYQVIEITARGPVEGGVDNKDLVARVVALTLELRRLV